MNEVFVFVYAKGGKINVLGIEDAQKQNDKLLSGVTVVS